VVFEGTSGVSLPLLVVEYEFERSSSPMKLPPNEDSSEDLQVIYPIRLEKKKKKKKKNEKEKEKEKVLMKEKNEFHENFFLCGCE
jgi:hypothetical protein